MFNSTVFGMDPDAYRQMRSLMKDPTPYIPVNEQEQGQDTSGQAGPLSDDNWTVYSMNVTRGNLNRPEDPNDPRTNIGWRATPTAGRAGDTPWMSTTERQPFMWSGGYVEKDDEATPRPTDHSAPVSSYPHPTLSLPHPSLSLDFRMSVALNPKISVGPTPFGHRNWISFAGGTWSGSWGTGIVLPGGQDSQLIIPDGSARLETNYLLQTYDEPPAHISVKTHGWRTGPPEILAQLADPKLADQIDPNSYKFRLFIEMETGDERYREKVNCGMWVGSGMRKGAEVIYDAYRLS